MLSLNQGYFSKASRKGLSSISFAQLHFSGILTKPLNYNGFTYVVALFCPNFRRDLLSVVSENNLSIYRRAVPCISPISRAISGLLRRGRKPVFAPQPPRIPSLRCLCNLDIGAPLFTVAPWPGLRTKDKDAKSARVVGRGRQYAEPSEGCRAARGSSVQ